MVSHLSWVQLRSGVLSRPCDLDIKSNKTRWTRPAKGTQQDLLGSRSNMAALSLTADDLSVYSQLSDEELLHVAVEQSFAQINCTSPAALAPPLYLTTVQSHQAPAPSSTNPPNSLTQLVCRRRKKELSPLQSLIVNGDVEALMDLIQGCSRSLTEPNTDGWIALHEAAYYGQLQCVQLLVRAHPDLVNTCTLQRGLSTLQLAAGEGHASCVEFLLNHGADPNVANKERDTSLFTACERPNEAVVELLLRFGAQVNCRCSLGCSPLHEACRNGNIALCSMLLQAGANLSSKNIYGIRPLFTAAQNGQSQVVRLLANRGADINAQALDGASPLFEASKNGCVSVVELLLSLKADANRSTKTGLLPLHVAVQNNHQRIVSLLIPVTSRVRVRHSGISPLHIAAEREHDDILEQLTAAGFDVNAQLSEERSRTYTDHRSTALYFSVCNCNLFAAEVLLAAGADPELDLFRPLLVAVRMGWVELVALLLKYGADVHAQVPGQYFTFPPALHLGLESPPTLKLLLDHGCDARACFNCCYGSNTHPPLLAQRRPFEELQFSGNPEPGRVVQFCEAISCPSFCHLTGPVVSVLLNYVGHIQLCSRLLEVLHLSSLWPFIKLKAYPPHPLMQLCRLLIRRLLGLKRLRLLHTLPLPVRLIRFLQYDVDCGLY